jgi:hypothetical protein
MALFYQDIGGSISQSGAISKCTHKIAVGDMACSSQTSAKYVEYTAGVVSAQAGDTKSTSSSRADTVATNDKTAQTKTSTGRSHSIKVDSEDL